MQDLIKRIEAADGPSRELDWAIYVRINGPDRDMEKVIARGSFNYTSSIDAAMTLVPEGCGWAAGNCGEENTPWACVTSPLDGDKDGGCKDYTSNASTPALALCAAALRARNG